MDAPSPTTATAIRHYRTVNSYSGSALCRKLGINRSTLYLWESGKQKPSPDHLRALAEVFGITINELK